MDDLRSSTLEDTQPVISSVNTNRKSGSFTSGCLGFLIDTVQTIILALILFLAINAVTARVRVENISMKPTLEPGEFVLVSKVAYKIGEPRHGDVVVFHYPRDPREDYVKRIIGLPGDHVVVSSGEVYVNDVLLDEPYIATPTGYNNSWTVPENSLFVLGDNRNQSSDSHVWGFVPLDQVVGKALAIYWPVNRFKILDSPDIVQASSAP